MRSLAFRKKIFLFMTVFSAVTGILGAVAAAVTALYLQYVWLAVAFVFAAHGFYGIVFYYIGYLNAAACERAIAAINAGELSYSALSPIMNRRIPELKKLLSACIVRDQLVGYTLGEDCLAPATVLEPEAADEPVETAVQDGEEAPPVESGEE